MNIIKILSCFKTLQALLRFFTMTFFFIIHRCKAMASERDAIEKASPKNIFDSLDDVSLSCTFTCLKNQFQNLYFILFYFKT